MNRIKRWKEWRKDCCCSLWHQILVLIGIRYDISFEITFTEEETKRLVENVRRFEASRGITSEICFDPDQAFEDDGK